MGDRGKSEELGNILKRLSIERLVGNKNNKQSIKSFQNKRNRNLQDYLRESAWGDDKLNETVVYLIKDENAAVCYFTLKCGMLLKNGTKKNSGAREPVISENQIFVNSTVPAIEIAQFCMNEKWVERHRVAKGCGRIIFYRYILPIISKFSKYIGCKFIYLYAADATEDETLVRYYENLRFKKVSDVEYCHVFPQYDLWCVLMFAALSSYKGIDHSFIADINEEEFFGQMQAQQHP